MRAVRLSIAGRVQGVGFRAWTRRTARSLGVAGWVQNEADGSVSAHAEGESELIDQFVAACHMGPPGAAVASVAVQSGTVEHFSGFVQR